MSTYTIEQVTPQLVYITWLRNPTDAETQQFLQDLNKILGNATQAQYFISDLRRGRIMSVRAINQLSQFTQHKHWGGSTAFSQNPISKMFAGNFHRMSRDNEHNSMFDQPEQAIAFLEALQPGLTSGVQWSELIGGAAAS